jgi:hypothetical protein
MLYSGIENLEQLVRALQMSFVAKIIYTLVLLGVSIVFLKEIWTVWLDRTLYVGHFDVITDTSKDDQQSANFPKRVVGAQAILAQQFNDYQTRRSTDAPSDATYVLAGMHPLLLPPEVLSGVDLTVQNIDLRQLLTAVRNRIVEPNEVTGSVTVYNNSVLATVSWPQSQTSTDFLVPSQPDTQSAAAYIGSLISWARAAAIDPRVAALSKDQFCDFSAALGAFYALTAKTSSAKLAEDDLAAARRHAAQLRKHYDSTNVFPEIYRLRADLLDLLDQQPDKLWAMIEAQEDRVRYAMRSEKLKGLSDEDKKFAALALTRPAIPFDGDKLSNTPENWSGLLDRYGATIGAAAAATGLIVRADGSPVGSGFLVAPGLVATATHVLSAGRIARNASQGKSAGGALRFCLGSSKSACDPALTIGETIYSGEAENSHVSLASVADHDPLLLAPLTIVSAPSDLKQIGEYAYVIGYPFRDARMPTPFAERLLGRDDGRKRLMPGRILDFGRQSASSSLETASDASANVFTSDISTTIGTAGGPLVELTTGHVLGMSYAGSWKGQRGKFANAEAFPQAALEIIARRLHGEADKPASQPQAATMTHAPPK